MKSLVEGRDRNKKKKERRKERDPINQKKAKKGQKSGGREKVRISRPNQASHVKSIESANAASSSEDTEF